MDAIPPLTDEEFDELEEFLLSDATPDECMDISMLDGFLTALAIGPNTLPPSQWLPVALGESEDDAMEWASPAQANHILSLIMRHMNDIIWMLTEAPDEYQPLLYQHEQDGEVISIIEEWCTGFMVGVNIDHLAWEPLFDEDELNDSILPIFLYGTDAGADELDANPELASRQEEHAQSLADCVLDIQEYWLPERKTRSTIRREAPKVGRNDPCPCGSGRKFKKCCGTSANEH